MRTAFDTSLIVAALSPWHEAHQPAHAALDQVLADAGRALLPIHALIEAYSVLTRLPAPVRLRSQDALFLLNETFESRTTLVGLEDGEVWQWLADQAEAEVAGGAIYDARILASARRAGAECLLTLNRRHFFRLGAREMGIEIPEI
jgi:predicted nucleic acid-binding protein